MSNSSHQIINFLKDAFPNGAALHQPYFTKEDSEAVVKCVASGWVSSVGENVNLFEKKIQDFTHIKNAVAVTNGTSALHLCYITAGIQPGDGVLCPSLTFVATLNALLYTGATPYFVDSEEETLGVDPIKLRAYLERETETQFGKRIHKETGQPIKALVVTHIFGHPCHLNELRDLCEEFGLKLIEDAAEALGSFYNGAHVGGVGDCSAISFNGNKIITTGGGGMFLSHDEVKSSRARHLSTTAKAPHAFEFFHDDLGYNYRLPNLNASLGVSQLDKISDIIKYKRKLASYYKSVFKDNDEVRFVEEPQKCQSNYWLNAIRVSSLENRNHIIMEAQKENIQLRPLWTPMHVLPYAKHFPKDDLSTTQHLYETIINLPSSYRCLELENV